MIANDNDDDDDDDVMLQTHGPVYIEYQVTMIFHRHQLVNLIALIVLVAGNCFCLSHLYHLL